MVKSKNKQPKALKVYLVGGGSGGHVTPLRSIAEQLVQKFGAQCIEATFVYEQGGKFAELMDVPGIRRKKTIFAGKFRRYHGRSFISQLFDFKTNILNVGDFFKFLIGCLQAFVLLIRWRPDVIFLKGGFVCVPIGWAARLLKIAYITHDSDAIPGLANRLTAKGAKKNLTALPVENYPYPKQKVIHTGVPVQNNFFVKLMPQKMANIRNLTGVQEEDFCLFITGGGLGARTLNQMVVQALEDINKGQSNKNLRVIHLTGKALYSETLELYQKSSVPMDRVTIIDFTTELWKYLRVADVVITRAGATAMAECAAAGKPTILVPNPLLTGGQQIHNARVFEEQGAGVVVAEGDNQGLLESVSMLMTDTKKRSELSQKIKKLAKQDSAQKIAEILSEIAGWQQGVL